MHPMDLEMTMEAVQIIIYKVEEWDNLVELVAKQILMHHLEQIMLQINSCLMIMIVQL